MKELRMEMRLKNNRLYLAINSKWKSVAAFCEHYNFNYGYVLGYINLTSTPIKKDGSYHKLALNIATALSIPEWQLFPESIYELEETSGVVEIELKELPAGRNFPKLAGESSPFEDVATHERNAQVAALLSELYPREQEVIRLRYGFDNCGVNLTIEETADKLRMTPNDVRRIEAKALRKLRCRSRAVILRPHHEF